MKDLTTRPYDCSPEYGVKRIVDHAETAARLEEGQVPCFAAGTLVHTKDGLKPIESIAVGDWVLSYPEDKLPPDHFREEHEYTYRQVKQVFVTENQPVSKLIVSNLATGERETIFVTGNHPIFCKDCGWIPVSSIEAGDVLENFRYRNLLVFRVYHDVENSRVYNLEVDEFHTYYVGEQGIWVHNKCEVESTKVAPELLHTMTEKKEVYMDKNGVAQ